jgi:hypothetical protein
MAMAGSRIRGGRNTRTSPTSTGPVRVGGNQPELDRVRRYADQGVARGVVQLTAEKADKILPLLDRWAGIIAKLNG